MENKCGKNHKHIKGCAGPQGKSALDNLEPKGVCRRVVFRQEYKDGDGFCVSVGEAPKEAIGADVICLHTAKGEKGTNNYYTPDEAMAVAMGLLLGVDNTLGYKFYQEFRTNSEIRKTVGIGTTRTKELFKKFTDGTCVCGHEWGGHMLSDNGRRRCIYGEPSEYCECKDFTIV